MARYAVPRRLRNVLTTYKQHGVTSFLDDPAQYRYLASLFRSGRVVMVRGDLTAGTSMTSIATAVQMLGGTVRLLYLSNAERYFTYTDAFRQSMLALPTDERPWLGSALDEPAPRLIDAQQLAFGYTQAAPVLQGVDLQVRPVPVEEARGRRERRSPEPSAGVAGSHDGEAALAAPVADEALGDHRAVLRYVVLEVGLDGAAPVDVRVPGTARALRTGECAVHGLLGA